MQNLERAKNFYEQELELPLIDYVQNKHAFFEAGDSILLLFNPEDSKNKVSPPPYYATGKQHLAFEVASSNYNEAKKMILAAGIAITDQGAWPGGSESFYFEDSEGNVLEIVPDKGVWM